MIDPITDMLNRIRNAQAVLHPTVSIPFSDLKYRIAKILEKEGFIKEVEAKGKKTKKSIEIILKYLSSKDLSDKNWKNVPQKPIISGLKRISKSGQRAYIPFKEIKKIKAGYGIAIMSTPKGLMTNKEARHQKIGGEVICEIW